ncbi:BAG family molecular chaperone regulator 8, chloroplastic-like [Coffea arabica]|uniref:BAG family molecular chaperone regulator 8, chloroplastic-like n=1 Tax=Coffea arabica TaxID=13443 RepID=A0ABM4V0Y0_COFAR
MAAHHHQQLLHCHPTTTSTVCFCYYCCPNYTSSHLHPVSDPHPLHHLHHPPQTYYSPYGDGSNPNPPSTTQSGHHHHHQGPHYRPPPTDPEIERYFHHDQQRELTHTHPIVCSLLRRIAALESSLRHHSSSHSHSLRDSAARIIQTHFRAFLVRRSRTLRQLKDLASIKSTFNTLKSSVSKNPHLDPQLLFRKALGLLFKLDSVQGGDPMIRDGKKSISRELTGFLDLIDGVTVKKSEISAKLVTKNAPRKCGVLYNEHKSGTFACRNLAKNKRLEDLVDRIDALSTKVPIGDIAVDEEDLEIPGISRNRAARSGHPSDGLGAKVKKSVSFVENGKVYRIHRKGFEPVPAGDCDSSGDESYSVGAEGELKDDIRRKAEEVGEISFKDTLAEEEDESQDVESSKSSDGVEGPGYELRNEDGGFTFSAPLPMKMETKADIMDRRKGVKIVG